MHNTATKPSSGWMESGAATSPARPVKTTSDITRGLARATKSRQSAGNAASPLLWRESAPEEGRRSEEHTSELQSLMRISYAGFCLKKKNIKQKAQYELRRRITSTPIHNKTTTDAQTLVH